MRYSDTMDETFRTGYGRDWLDFGVTLLNRYAGAPQDLVSTPDRLQAWLTAWNLAPVEPVTEHDVARAQGLREALHGLAKAAAAGQAPTSADVRVVDASLKDDAPRSLLHSACLSSWPRLWLRCFPQAPRGVPNPQLKSETRFDLSCNLKGSAVLGRTGRSDWDPLKRARSQMIFQLIIG